MTRSRLTQTEARARLKALTADLTPPKPTRPEYAEPERERLRIRLATIFDWNKKWGKTA